MRELIVHGAAQCEMEEAQRWYARRKRGTAARFWQRIDEAYGAVLDAPDRWRKIFGEYRQYRVQRFPFAIIYRADETRVFVVAVAHFSRRPGYWIERIEDQPF